MYRRVLIPMGVSVGIVVGLWLLGAVSSLVERSALNQLRTGAPHWMLPVLPATGWLTFVVVFFAVRLCALRDGSRRDCIAVGLAPVALALVPWLMVVTNSGLSSLPTVLGITTAIRHSGLDLGAVVAVRETTEQVLGLAATCISATWLWFFVSKQRAITGLVEDPPEADSRV